MRAFKLFAKLAKIAAPSLGALGPALAAKSFEQVSLDDLTYGVQKLAEQLDDPTPLLREILQYTSVVADRDGRQVKIDLTDELQIDAAFEGRLWDMCAVAAFALEVNFRDFFADAGRSLSNLVPPAKE